MQYEVLALSVLVGLAARLGGLPDTWAWCLGAVVVPAWVLYGVFGMPYAGGGASMWPIAAAVGGALGVFCSGAGVLVARWLRTRPDRKA